MTASRNAITSSDQVMLQIWQIMTRWCISRKANTACSCKHSNSGLRDVRCLVAQSGNLRVSGMGGDLTCVTSANPTSLPKFFYGSSGRLSYTGVDAIGNWSTLRPEQKVQSSIIKAYQAHTCYLRVSLRGFMVLCWGNAACACNSGWFYLRQHYAWTAQSSGIFQLGIAGIARSSSGRGCEC